MQDIIKKRNIDNNTILHGMSMSKTALSTTITSIFSVDANYKFGNLFSYGIISKIASEIN